VRHRFKARKTQKSARALDRVHQPENAADQVLVIRILFQLDDVAVESIQAFGCFRQKFLNEIVH
jgi:hypothetical protein